MSALTPAVLFTQTNHHGGTASLCLVRTHFKNEGSALLEILTPEGDLDFVENGEWRIAPSRDDDGEATPATLSVEFDDSGDVENLHALLDHLMGELVRIGGSWGLDGYAPNGAH